jgi:hypothetical protein
LSRIEAAKRRSAGVKRALAVLAAAGMVVAGLLARATNPGHVASRASRATSSPSTAAASSSESDDSSSSSFSIAPSASQPQVQTSVS